MAKSPKDPKELFPEITTDYKKLFGRDLVSIVLYGSAVGKEYRPGKSDINFMVVLSEKGIENLDQAIETANKWRKRNVAIPLFLTENYVETSMDSFPIEYLSFQRNCTLVFGKDILSDLVFQPEHVRLQCEREIKGKLLLLRQALLESSGKAKALEGLISQSLQAFTAIFAALLYLKGIEIPKERRAILTATCKAFDLETATFEKLLDIKEEATKLSDNEAKRLFMDYLREVRKLSKQVDRFGGEHE